MGSSHLPLKCYPNSRGPQTQLLVHNPAPICGGQGETEERGRPLQIGLWEVQYARELHRRLVLLGGCKMSRSPHFPTKILKVSIEALTGFGHVFSPDGLNTLLSQGCILGTAPTLGTVRGRSMP